MPNADQIASRKLLRGPFLSRGTVRLRHAGARRGGLRLAIQFVEQDGENARREGHRHTAEAAHTILPARLEPGFRCSVARRSWPCVLQTVVTGTGAAAVPRARASRSHGASGLR